MVLKKKLSVKKFAKLVGHHSEGNIRVFRERLRLKGIIKNNEPLTEDLVPVWKEIFTAHEQQGVSWTEAMDHVIDHSEYSVDQSKPQPSEEVITSKNDEKMDEIITLLNEILVELRKEKVFNNQ
ncbi:hypothetical protein [Bacillus sp. 1NLA3E]|uniref:hypothetical protein n=1 Tax=Bacillus sp. 1NLA3E TaxID=666686 RepID=UPI000247EDB3|nr:hypothetical protein [Bacillus sp. 1NLA3E]AGK54129.1 hypothetical protein B1NLA3E_11895 [Bacillus sp. 1NLA3E]